MLRLLILLSVVITTSLSGTLPSFSQTRYTQKIEGEFEDVFFDLQDAIINLGLVVERTGDIGAMLKRTSKAVAGTDGENSPTYSNAKYLLFCSAQLTTKATAADPKNLSICPFIVYAYETKLNPGQTTIGYRNPDLGDLAKSDPLYVEIHDFLRQLIDGTVEGF